MIASSLSAKVKIQWKVNNSSVWASRDESSRLAKNYPS